jgi:hypothetical protein
MKAHLLYADRDFDWKWVLQAAAEREAARAGRRHEQSKEFNPRSGLPWNKDALTADLALSTLFAAMAQKDEFVLEVSRKVILSSLTNDLETIRYRQDILRDCLSHPAVVRELYAVAVEGVESERKHYLGTLDRYPDWVLRRSVELMEALLVVLRKLRKIAESHGREFAAEGWRAFFSMLERELGDDYCATVEDHLRRLKFRGGVLLSAELGRGNKGRDYVLHRPPIRKGNWLTRLFTHQPPTFSFALHPRDEGGARILSELQNRGIAIAASSLGRSADHVRSFFNLLRSELAFYVGCLNLHERLSGKGEPVCFPEPSAAGERRLSFEGLYEVCLALNVSQRVVGNDANADWKDLVIVTGPNTGGKSTFLRSVGLAQLMMQSGMFAPAVVYRASLCDGLSTHYKREEDTGMESGKFDEELNRMSEIVDHITPHAMILFNESFAATNEREGSEIARQIMSALLEKGIRVFCVTHMYELSHGFYEQRMTNALFLRAARQADGVRTFKLSEGQPLQTSFGEDLYQRIFGDAEEPDEIDHERMQAGAP